MTYETQNFFHKYRPPERRHKAELGECKYCDGMRKRNKDYHPSHDPHLACISGKRPHCACDQCFG